MTSHDSITTGGTVGGLGTLVGGGVGVGVRQGKRVFLGKSNVLICVGVEFGICVFVIKIVKVGVKVLVAVVVC